MSNAAAFANRNPARFEAFLAARADVQAAAASLSADNFNRFVDNNFARFAADFARAAA